MNYNQLSYIKELPFNKPFVIDINGVKYNADLINVSEEGILTFRYITKQEDRYIGNYHTINYLDTDKYEMLDYK